MAEAAPYQNTQGPVQATGERTVPQDFGGGTIGGAAKGVLNAASEAQDLAAVWDHAAKLADQANARDQGLTDQAAGQALVAKYATLQGTGATNAQADILQQITKVREAGMAKLGSDRQRQYYTKMWGHEYDGLLNAVNTHAFQQAHVAQADSLASVRDQRQAGALSVYADPKAFAVAQGQVAAAARAEAAFAGKDPTATDEYVNTQVGHVALAAIQSAINAGDVDTAKAHQNQYWGQMNFQQRAQALDMMAKPLLARTVSDTTDAVMANAAGVSVMTPSPDPHERAAAVSAGAPAGVTWHQPTASGRVSDDYAAHAARGSHGVDYPAPINSGVVPLGPGKVTEVASDPRSGTFVKVEHPGGIVTSYAHLGSVAVQPGDQVDGTLAIGTVGLTGETTGPHVHVRARDAQGNDIDPAKLMKGQGPNAVIAKPNPSVMFDLPTMLARVDANKTLSPEMADMVKAEIKRRYSYASDLQNVKWSNATDSYATAIGQYEQAHGATPPASVVQSWASFRGLKPSTQAEVLGNLAIAANEKAQADRFDGLEMQSVTDRDGFMKVDTRTLAGALTSSQLRTIAMRQAEYKAEDNARAAGNAIKVENWVPYQPAYDAMQHYARFNPGVVPVIPSRTDANYGKVNAERAEILRTVVAFAKGRQAAGVIPSPQELYDTVARATRMVGLKNGGQARAFDLTAGGLSDQTKATLRANMARRGHTDPSDQELLDEYRMRQGGPDTTATEGGGKQP